MFSSYASDFSFVTILDQLITRVTTDWSRLVLQDTADTGRTREDVHSDVTVSVWGLCA